ncbi:hypothetical protein D0U04_23675 [Bacillus clarus]|uniref:Uncharacterized protein n=1 Tax=Bacillus clarus TaxID=2338372 RepID=A0A090Z234_9BACI|nr:hypothetical protein [Bacillus clarus]KFN04682.1 hypothetical protein DJ93_5931 [Bacillus clarus]RFT63873.1 hypothetical protein D0U04_23675 [Bacillus clarus]
MIFLFQFENKEDGIDFVLNEKIAFDMHPHHEKMLRPLVHSTCQILDRYKQFSQNDILMTSKIFDNDKLGVMLSDGLGTYIDPYTKYQILFASAKSIADILIEVMEQRTLVRK